jgi:hypothetical protein
MSTLFAHADWQLIVAVGVAFFTVVSYILNRRRELAWRRTEFLCAQSQYLDNDADLVEMVKILEDRHSSIAVAHIFDKIRSIRRTEAQRVPAAV